MTKEEFLRIISAELEKLEPEYRKAYEICYKQQRSYTEDISPEYHQAKLIVDRYDTLLKLVDMPAYARIQASSDIEIEEHRKAKIQELKLKIQEIEKSGGLSYEAASEFFERKYYISLSAENQISEISRMISDIEHMSVEEFKEKLSAKLPYHGSRVASIADDSKRYFERDLDSIEQLMVSVAGDSEKTKEFAELLQERRFLSNEKHRSGTGVYVPDLPEYFKKIIGHGSYSDEELDKLVRKIDAAVKSRDEFLKEYSYDDLFKLVGKENGTRSSTVDFEFLEKHVDKLFVNTNLDYLKQLVAKRDKLSKKIIKTRKTKTEIKGLNDTIAREQSDIYKEIIRHYKGNNGEVYGVNVNVDFLWDEDLKDCLAKLQESVAKSNQKIAEIRTQIEEAKKKNALHRQECDQKIAAINQKLAALGNKDQKAVTDGYRYDLPNPNPAKDYRNVEEAATKNYEYQMVRNIQQEAQRQADEEQARLMGISVEELLRMRYAMNSSLNINNENISLFDDEDSKKSL